MSATPPELSVIIPSYNSGRKMLDCLESLRAQSTRARFEIIVVDSRHEPPFAGARSLGRFGIRRTDPATRRSRWNGDVKCVRILKRYSHPEDMR